MNQYLDTSLVVAAMTREARSSQVQVWLRDQRPGTLIISDWVMTEFSSALSFKLRKGQITADFRDGAAQWFSRLAHEALEVVAVSRAHFHTAARFAERNELGLRASDALHLAISAGHGAHLCTLDARLQRAAEALGVPCQAILGA